MNDDQELDDLIRQTHPKPEFASSFQREVWARIAVAEQKSWATAWRQWSESLLGWIARPAPAVAVVIAMLALGVGLGQMRMGDRPGENALAVYVASIHPEAAARVATHR